MTTATTVRNDTADEVGLDQETLASMLTSLREFVDAKLPIERRLELDHEDTCPEDTVRAMCGDQLGVQLVFVPEEYGGFGGGAFDSYRVCEGLAHIDIGLATSVFATALGSDPILGRGDRGAEGRLVGPYRRAGRAVRVRRDRA